MNDKPADKPATKAAEPTPLERALAALKPFAHLPISDAQPDDAHPAFQVQVAFVRAARALFPADFPPAKAAKADDTATKA